MANALHFTDGAKFRVELVSQGLVFYEKSVQPRGEAGGDKINISTNDNVSRESFAPRTRSAPTPAVLVCTYDSTDYDAYMAAIGVADTILVTYPDDSTRTPEAGWLNDFVPEVAEHGTQPTATATFEYQGEAPV